MLPGMIKLYSLLVKPFPVLVVGEESYLYKVRDQVKSKKLSLFSQRCHGHATFAF